MLIYRLKAFGRFQRRERIADDALAKAVRDAESGLVDADLRGGLIKQRVARPGRGKSGSYRTIIAYRRGDRAVFLYGFAKNERANLDDAELAYWRRIGGNYLSLDDEGMEAAIAVGELAEVGHGDED